MDVAAAKRRRAARCGYTRHVTVLRGSESPWFLPARECSVARALRALRAPRSIVVTRRSPPGGPCKSGWSRTLPTTPRTRS